MAEKVPKSTRLPKDEAELIEAYAEEHELTEADALRRLIRSGLENEPVLVTRNAQQMGTFANLVLTSVLLILFVLVFV